MTKYEYQVIVLHYDLTGVYIREINGEHCLARRLEWRAYLQDMGQEGWQLAGIVGGATMGNTCYLMRPLAQKRGGKNGENMADTTL